VSLVRVYRSNSGREFRVLLDDDGHFVCTCKEYRASMVGVSFDVGNGRYIRTCRHIRKYKAESADWDANPLTKLDWL